MDFTHYAKTYNNLCLVYSGDAPEYAVQLDYILPIARQTFPGFNISLCVPELFLPLTKHAIPVKEDCAFVKEIHVNPLEHSVLKIMEGLTFPRLEVKTGGICLICPDAAPPTKNVKISQKGLVVGSRLHPRSEVDVTPEFSDVVDLIKSAGWVIGAENEYVFLAASMGIRTTLVPSGIGTDLYRAMFPHGEIWN